MPESSESLVAPAIPPPPPAPSPPPAPTFPPPDIPTAPPPPLHSQVDINLCPTCGTTADKSLVVCIDGTSNEFGARNTNVVELYSRLVKNSKHRTFYNSGIGTYAEPHSLSLRQRIATNIDLAIAWNFDRVLLSAYRWLAENYEEGDRIFLFGFSRGAYQVRALSAMIEDVGLIHRGNQDQIPFLSESSRIKFNLDKSRSFYIPVDTASTPVDMAKRFRDTFSRTVKVHFVGAWDTVSSVGLVYDKTLPKTTDGMQQVCFFRHALALHERRIKFLPEFAQSARVTAATPTDSSTRPHSKEVWFAGSHSDIGGGNVPNMKLDRFGPSLRWMSFESIIAGLQLTNEPRNWEEQSTTFRPSRSLDWKWWILELLPLKRRRFTNDDKRTEFTRAWHKGAWRRVRDGQLLHETALRVIPPSCLPTTLRKPAMQKAPERAHRLASEAEETIRHATTLGPVRVETAVLAMAQSVLAETRVALETERDALCALETSIIRETEHEVLDALIPSVVRETQRDATFSALRAARNRIVEVLEYLNAEASRPLMNLRSSWPIRSPDLTRWIPSGIETDPYIDALGMLTMLLDGKPSFADDTLPRIQALISTGPGHQSIRDAIQRQAVQNGLSPQQLVDDLARCHLSKLKNWDPFTSHPAWRMRGYVATFTLFGVIRPYLSFSNAHLLHDYAKIYVESVPRASQILLSLVNRWKPFAPDDKLYGPVAFLPRIAPQSIVLTSSSGAAIAYYEPDASRDTTAAITFDISSEEVDAVAVSCDGGYIALAHPIRSEEDNVPLESRFSVGTAESKEPSVSDLPTIPVRVTSLAFGGSGPNTRLIIGCKDGTVRITYVTSQSAPELLPGCRTCSDPVVGSSYSIAAVAASDHSSHGAAVYADGFLLVWDIGSATSTPKSLDTPGDICDHAACLAFSPVNKHLVVGGTSARVFEVMKVPVAKVAKEHSVAKDDAVSEEDAVVDFKTYDVPWRYTVNACFSSDGNHLCLSSLDYLCVCEVWTGKIVSEIIPTDFYPIALEFVTGVEAVKAISPDGRVRYVAWRM